MDPDTHIQRMSVHLGQTKPVAPTRPDITPAHDRLLAEDARILHRYITRGVVPPDTS